MHVSLSILFYLLAFAPWASSFLVLQHAGRIEKSSLMQVQMIKGLNKFEFDAISSGRSKSIKDLLGDTLSSTSTSTTRTKFNADILGDEKNDVITANSRPFSRIVNVAQIPLYQTVLCKIKASDKERQYVADELNIVGIESLTANVSLSWVDKQRSAVNVVGNIRLKLSNPLSTLTSDEVDDNFPSSNEELLEDLTKGFCDITYSVDDSLESIQYPSPLLPQGDDDVFTLETPFESCLLHKHNKVSNKSKYKNRVSTIAGEKVLTFDGLEDCDDEIPSSGDIDIGSLIVQYISLEHF